MVSNQHEVKNSKKEKAEISKYFFHDMWGFCIPKI